jgi:hypothetical protein
MVLAPIRRLTDFAFVAALLGVASVPLVFLRGSPLLYNRGVLLGAAAAWLATLGCWVWARRGEAGVGAPREAPRPRDWLRRGAVCALLLALVVVGYYLPLRKHFWLGMDEFLSLGRDCPSLWDAEYDCGWGRPLVAWWIRAARWLTPDRIEGFLWVAVSLCFLNALLLYRLLGRVLPNAGCVAAAAAVLFVCNSAEASRFYVFYGTNVYWSALALLLLAAGMFLGSHDRGGRVGLAASCVVLGGALLVNEAVFPLALLPPLLTFLPGRRKAGRLLWGFAWLGSVALLAARFALRLLAVGSKSYQMTTTGDLMKQPSLLLLNLGRRFLTCGDYFEVSGAWPEHWKAGAAAVALVLALFLLLRGGVRPAPSRRGLAAGLALGAAAAVLGLAPMLHLRDSVRTCFLAGPGQAVLAACAVALAGSFASRRTGPAVLAAFAALAAGNAAVAALHSQAEAARAAPLRFERVAYLIRQFHAVASALPDDALAVLLLDEGAPPPCARVFDAQHLFRRCFGLEAAIWNPAQPSWEDPYPNVAGLWTSHYAWPIQPDGSVALRVEGRFHYYSQIVVFRVRRDGTLQLLRDLSPPLIPADAARIYDPLAVLRPGPVEPPPFFRYPSWMRRPLEVFPTSRGVVLGKNWSLLDHTDREAFLWAGNDAEIIVNPAGRRRWGLQLDLECPAAADGSPRTLTVYNRAGEPVQTASPAGRSLLRLDLPTDPGRLEAFRFHIDAPADADPSRPVFRVFSPGRDPPGHWQFLAPAGRP